jgi:hypothetical protein
MSSRTNTPEQSDLAHLSSIFTSRVLGELSEKGQSQSLGRLLRQSRLSKEADPTELLCSLLDRIYGLLTQDGPVCEYAIKNAVTSRILLGRHSLRTATMLSEFRVGDTKLDLAILNGTSTAYEIKSDRDDLGRLSKQVAAYSRIFSSVFVVTGERLAAAAERLAADHIGVLMLTRRGSLSQVRPATLSLDRIDPDCVFESIRLSEAQAILAINDIHIGPGPNTTAFARTRSCFKALTPDQAHSGFVATLRRTRSLLAQQPGVDAVPACLRAYLASARPHERQVQNLMSALCQPLGAVLDWA